MKVQKTIKYKIANLTERKKKTLEEEYKNFQKYLHENEDADLYSANKQQAGRYYEEINKDKEYPISVRKDLIDIRKNSNKLLSTG